MIGRRPRLAAAVGAVFLVASCGSGDSDVATVDAAQIVGEAIEQTASADSYRATSYSAQTLQVDVLGLDNSSTIDPDAPASFVESDGSGSTYAYVDVAAAMAGMTGGAGPTAYFEMWDTPDGLVFDTTGYQGIVDLDPSAQLGPFRPGVWTIDSDGLDADDQEIIAALGGGPVLSPADLADSLLDEITDIEPIPDDPTRYTATTTYRAILAATGQDLEDVADSAAAGVALSLGVDADALGDFYEQVYDAAPTDLELTVVDGELVSMLVTIDLSEIWSGLFDAADELGIEISEEERAAVADGLDAAVFDLVQLTEFESDPDIVVTPPTGELEDRTDEVLELFAN